jgi:hypothetical protein
MQLHTLQIADKWLLAVARNWSVRTGGSVGALQLSAALFHISFGNGLPILLSPAIITLYSVIEAL